MRRTDERHLKSSIDNKITKFGELIFDPKLSIIWKRKFKILLTKKECELLNELIKLHGKPVNRNMLAKNLNLGSRRIDVTISRLRTKIETNPRNPIHILTIRGEGYSLSGIKS